jgi:hypothetical protein
MLLLLQNWLFHHRDLTTWILLILCIGSALFGIFVIPGTSLGFVMFIGGGILAYAGYITLIKKKP